MKIKSISFENYKAFKEKQTLELKPITLLLGKNSSGKSVITKLFTLLDNSLSRRIDAPLLLNNYGVELGAEFRDLVYGREPNSPISFNIEYQNNSNLSVKIIQPINSHKIEFLEWRMLLNNGDFIEYSKEKNIFHTKDEKQVFIDLRGFLPNLNIFYENYKNIRNYKDLDISHTNFENMLEFFPFIDNIILNDFEIDYIEPFRVLPKRHYYFEGETEYKSVSTNGKDAYQVLIDSYLSGKDDENSIYNQVSNWYEEKFGWKLEIKDNNSFYEFLLSKNDIKVNLADVGQGMHQALPLVVRAFMYVEDSIVVIEQPELHLHTFAHADLAELFAKSAKTNNQTFVIETHAENILLRLRKLVIDNDFGFTKDDIIIYWVDENENGGQKITPITIDEEGTLSDWFDDAFNENLQEMYAMDKALAKKNKSKL
ncbi:MAG: DUF3696 domain-containing protein [Bacteroidetes bacterium]|nr:MAG: DUF3696 domain-containing protein [Bacteroidota bacterium]